MMDTVLNLGLNDQSVKGLAAGHGDERFAYDSYRRFISMYGRIVLGHRRRRSSTSRSRRPRRRPASPATPTCRPPPSRSCATTTRPVVKEETGKAFPQDPIEQLRGAIEAVFRSWNGARAIAYRARSGSATTSAPR